MGRLDIRICEARRLDIKASEIYVKCTWGSQIIKTNAVKCNEEKFAFWNEAFSLIESGDDISKIPLIIELFDSSKETIIGTCSIDLSEAKQGIITDQFQKFDGSEIEIRIRYCSVDFGKTPTEDELAAQASAGETKDRSFLSNLFSFGSHSNNQGQSGLYPAYQHQGNNYFSPQQGYGPQKSYPPPPQQGYPVPPALQPGKYPSYPQTQQGYPSYQQGYPPRPQQGGYGAPPPQQGGYQQYPPYQQGGYPQLPQQGGYPQQPPLPQQGSYPQQPPTPQQGGYGAYPPTLYPNSGQFSGYNVQPQNPQYPASLYGGVNV